MNVRELIARATYESPLRNDWPSATAHSRRVHLEQADTILTALSQAGLVICPVEPTVEMADAGLGSEIETDDVRAIYRAMVKAASHNPTGS